MLPPSKVNSLYDLSKIDILSWEYKLQLTLQYEREPVAGSLEVVVIRTTL